MLKKFYIGGIVGSASLSYVLYLSNDKTGLLILLGIFAPVFMSFLNIVLIELIHGYFGNQVTNYFNIFQFLIKSVFMLLMSYLGVKTFNLNFKYYIPLLCVTWFSFHIVEGFFVQNLLQKEK